MSELERFRDGKLIDSDFITLANDAIQQRSTPGRDDLEDEFMLEKFIVSKFKCKGPQHFPICLYDFTVRL
jgi:hypothetical protein